MNEARAWVCKRDGSTRRRAELAQREPQDQPPGADGRSSAAVPPCAASRSPAVACARPLFWVFALLNLAHSSCSPTAVGYKSTSAAGITYTSTRIQLYSCIRHRRHRSLGNRSLGAEVDCYTLIFRGKHPVGSCSTAMLISPHWPASLIRYL
jgi:hypothetical protein